MTEKSNQEQSVKGIKKPKTHVAEWKKKEVEELKNLMKKKSVIVVSIKNLPAAQF